MSRFNKPFALAGLLVVAPSAIGQVLTGPGIVPPDNDPAGASSTITIADSFLIDDFVAVTIGDLNHTWAGDLVVTLSHMETGTTVTLLDRPGVPDSTFGDSADFQGNYVWRDGAFVYDADIYDTLVPADAPFGPVVGAFTAFVGEDAAGTWTLTISDNAAGDIGEAAAWALRVRGAGNCVEDLSGNGAVDFADILSILATWGPCFACPEDLSGNGVVDFADVLQTLSEWGPCSDLSGACCLPDHACAVMPEDACVSGGGSYQGDGTTCDVDFCGSCCIPGYQKDDCVFGEIFTPAACEAIGGYFLGECTYCAGFCDFVDWGACCLKDGTCLESSVLVCKDLGGVFTQGGASCDCVTCEPSPTGACCDPFSFTCSIQTETQCEGVMRGSYLGDDSVCPAGTGACCLGEDACFEGATQVCCEAFGGVYLGDGSDCSGGCKP